MGTHVTVVYDCLDECFGPAADEAAECAVMCKKTSPCWTECDPSGEGIPHGKPDALPKKKKGKEGKSSSKPDTPQKTKEGEKDKVEKDKVDVSCEIEYIAMIKCNMDAECDGCRDVSADGESIITLKKNLR